MGTYIVEADLDAAFAEANVDKWADRDGDSTADAGVIDLGIDNAEGEFEAMMRDGAYALPMTFNDTGSEKVVKQALSRMAAANVYFDRGMTDEDDDGKDKMSRLAAEGRRTIAKIVAGVLRLDAGLSHSGPTAPIAV